MKKDSMRTFVLVLCCSAIAFAAEARTVHFADKPAIDVRFDFQDKVVSLHEPVVLLFKVHNGLSQPITVKVGALVRQYFDLVLTTPNGQVLHKDPFEGLVDIVTSGNGTVVIEPGDDYKEPLVMNKWFPFAAQGTYTLTSRLTSDIETADGTFQAESRTAQLRVNPRDPARLSKICEELEKQAEGAQTAEAARYPTLALSYVEDPIAVPYLARLLSSHALLSDTAVVGLARIGNDAAIEVLLSALNDSWGNIDDAATRSLAQIQDRIADPRLKETVQRAVQHKSERTRNEAIKAQIAYLDYRDPDLQHTAIQTLTQMNALEQAAPVLQRLANDPNQPPNVVADAKAALQRIHLQ
jgi:non-ribosomal peptide synthetase component F